MSPLVIKVIAGLSIFGIAIVGGMIPILVARQQASRRYLSLGNALAGGIFLGVGFVHLLPEADEALRGVVDYPLAPLLAALGVGLLLLIDRVVLENRNSMLGQEEEEPTRPPFYAFVLLVVLSVHSIIAGMALGLQPEAAAALVVMFGILFHKGSAAFALIVTAHAAGNRALWQTLALFSVMTPIGIVLGTVAGEVLQGRASLVFEGSFNALAAGTFVYVAVMDVLDAELSRERDRIAHYVRSALIGDDDVPMPEQDRDRWLKFALVLIGIAVMAIMSIWHVHPGHAHDGHDHGHAHGQQEAHAHDEDDEHDEADHEGHAHDEAGHDDDGEAGGDDRDEAGHDDHDGHDHEDGDAGHDDHDGHDHG